MIAPDQPLSETFTVTHVTGCIAPAFPGHLRNPEK